MMASHMSKVAETERLRIRHFNKDDAKFIVKLLNEGNYSLPIVKNN